MSGVKMRVQGKPQGAVVLKSKRVARRPKTAKSATMSGPEFKAMVERLFGEDRWATVLGHYLDKHPSSLRRYASGDIPVTRMMASWLSMYAKLRQAGVSFRV